MKKTLPIIFICILPIMLSAQEFKGGFFGGLSMNQIEGDDYRGFNKGGFTAGAYTLRRMSRRLDLRMELRYIQKGVFKRKTEIDPSYYKLNLHYIELPFLLLYKVRRNFFIGGGISPDILLYSKEEDENGVMQPQLHPKFMRFSAGANLDVSWALTSKIIVGTRFTYSVLPVREQGGGVTYRYDRGLYSNTLSFIVNYQL